MTKYMYQGLKRDVTEVIARIRYSNKVNMYYMNRLLPEYFGKRWTSDVDQLWRAINGCLRDFREVEQKQSLLDMAERMLAKLKLEVEWTDLDTKAIEFLGVKYFTELREEQRDALNDYYSAITHM